MSNEEKLKEQLSIAVQALEFYAEGKNYEFDETKHGCCLIKDGGQKAEEALNKIQELEK